MVRRGPVFGVLEDQSVADHAYHQPQGTRRGSEIAKSDQGPAIERSAATFADLPAYVRPPVLLPLLGALIWSKIRHRSAASNSHCRENPTIQHAHCSPRRGFDLLAKKTRDSVEWHDQLKASCLRRRAHLVHGLEDHGALNLPGLAGFCTHESVGVPTGDFHS